MFKNYIKIKESNIGLGAFTTIDIPANVPMEATGNIYTFETLKPEDKDYALQIGNNSYLGPSGGVDDYINHNCNPNCYFQIVGNRAILYSMYVLKAGMELTFDYSSTSNDDLNMKCLCGSHVCREIISGYQLLDKRVRDDYDSREVSVLYLRDKRFI